MTCWIWLGSAAMGGRPLGSRCPRGHVLGKRGRQQAHVLLHQGVQVHGADLEVPAARIGEHLTRESRRSFGGRHRLLHVHPRRVALGELAEGEGVVAQHHREQVVEVVGHAPREDAQALHLLGQAQGLLGAPALGHVVAEGENAGAARDLDGLRRRAAPRAAPRKRSRTPPRSRPRAHPRPAGSAGPAAARVRPRGPSSCDVRSTSASRGCPTRRVKLSFTSR